MPFGWYIIYDWLIWRTIDMKWPVYEGVGGWGSSGERQTDRQTERSVPLLDTGRTTTVLWEEKNVVFCDKRCWIVCWCACVVESCNWDSEQCRCVTAAFAGAYHWIGDICILSAGEEGRHNIQENNYSMLHSIPYFSYPIQGISSQDAQPPTITVTYSIVEYYTHTCAPWPVYEFPHL